MLRVNNVHDFLMWFTSMEHTKPLTLVLFFVTFVGIIWYVFANRERSERLESRKYIPLDDDNVQQDSHKVTDHE